MSLHLIFWSPPLQHHKQMSAPNDCMHLMVSLLSTPSLEKRPDPRCLRCVVLTLFVLGVVKPQSSAAHVQWFTGIQAILRIIFFLLKRPLCPKISPPICSELGPGTSLELLSWCRSAIYGLLPTWHCFPVASNTSKTTQTLKSVCCWVWFGWRKGWKRHALKKV